MDSGSRCLRQLVRNGRECSSKSNQLNLTANSRYKNGSKKEIFYAAKNKKPHVSQEKHEAFYKSLENINYAVAGASGHLKLSTAG